MPWQEAPWKPTDGFSVMQHKGSEGKGLWKWQQQCHWSCTAVLLDLVGFWAWASFLWLTVRCWGMHMFLHRCTPSSSLVDSLSKASYLARPYVLGHGDSVMWKEHRIILGLQTPAGATQSKFCLQGDPELLSLHHRTRIMIKCNFFSRLSKSSSIKPFPFVLSQN